MLGTDLESKSATTTGKHATAPAKCQDTAGGGACLTHLTCRVVSAAKAASTQVKLLLYRENHSKKRRYIDHLAFGITLIHMGVPSVKCH